MAGLLHGVPHVVTAHSLEPLRPWKAEQLRGGYALSAWAERTADEHADAVAWLERFGNPFWLVVVDYEGRYAIDWGIYGAPETYLVDADGIIRWKHVGPLTDAVVEDELLPALAKLEVPG